MEKVEEGEQAKNISVRRGTELGVGEGSKR